MYSKILYNKLLRLYSEVESAINIVQNDDMKEYLLNYKLHVTRLMELTKTEQLKFSDGGLLGVLRAISEYDDLSHIKSLYEAAYEVEDFYSNIQHQQSE